MKALLRFRRPGRPISVSAVPCVPGIDIWRSCRFIGAFFRSFVLCLAVLVGSCLAELVPVTASFGTSVGEEWPWAHFSAKRIGLRSIPEWLLLLFRYSPRSALALLEGTSLLQYCAGRFSSRVLSWRLPAGGYAADFVTEGSEEVGSVRVEPCAPADMPCFDGGGGVSWNGGHGGRVKRVRLKRKTPWKRLRGRDHLCGDHADAKARRVHWDDEAYAAVQDRTGVGLRLSGACAGPRLQAVHEFNQLCCVARVCGVDTHIMQCPKQQQ